MSRFNGENTSTGCLRRPNRVIRMWDVAHSESTGAFPPRICEQLGATEGWRAESSEKWALVLAVTRLVSRTCPEPLTFALLSMFRVLYEGKERPKPGFQVLDTTPYSHSANLAPPGPGHPRTYLTCRRAAEGAGLHALGITDVCLVLPSKGEGTPHTYCRLPRNLNPGVVSGACGLLGCGRWVREAT